MGMSMKKLNIFALAATAVLVGYYLWSFFVDSRYQSLCNVSYWSATQEQIDACKDVKTQLDNK
jgi:hypothetical protein